MTAPGGDLLAGEPHVASVGANLFADALVQQGATVTTVEWQAPPAGTAPLLAAVAADPRRPAANHLAVSRMMAAAPMLIDIVPARDALGLGPGELLHAGPPVAWETAAGPLRGAVVGALLYEGVAGDPAAAERLVTDGRIALVPCHDRRAVGPMAGVISPSMPVLVMEDAAHGGRAFSSLNEGLGKVLRYGAYGPEVLSRLRWMEKLLAPTLRAALRSHGPLDVKLLVSQALQMGDECHNRNRAATSLLVRELGPALATCDAENTAVAATFEFLAGNDHFFLNLAMAAAKAAADAGRAVPGSTMVVAMARNGTEYGIQTAGTGDRWFTGPAAVPDGLYLGAYGPDDASPDIGDSAITEVTGLGGFAMAAAPAIIAFVGGDASNALAATLDMYEVTLTESVSYQVPALDFRGVPTGIDVARVVRTGLLPLVNTGIAGKVPGTGQIGAGLSRPPMAAFVSALEALADDARRAAGAGSAVGAR